MFSVMVERTQQLREMHYLWTVWYTKYIKHEGAGKFNGKYFSTSFPNQNQSLMQRLVGFPAFQMMTRSHRITNVSQKDNS